MIKEISPKNHGRDLCCRSAFGFEEGIVNTLNRRFEI